MKSKLIIQVICFLLISFTYSIVFCPSIFSQCDFQAFQFGSNADGDGDAGLGITTCGDNCVIITGSFEEIAMFGDSMVTAVGTEDRGAVDLFVAKFVGDSLIWIKHAGGQKIPNQQTGINLGKAVTTDLFTNVIFTGTYLGSPTFDTVTLPSGGPNEDFFLAKYESNGDLLWVLSGLGTYQVHGNDVLTDSMGNIYACGTFGHHNFSGNVNFSGTVFTSTGGRDIFLVKHDAQGNLLWARKAGSSILGSESGENLSFDADGNIVITGFFIGSANFGGMNVSSSGGQDIFIAKYDTSGTILWVKKAGGSGNDVGYGVDCDTLGNIYITGEFEGTVTFDTISLLSKGVKDIFVAKYDTNGNVLWAKRAGGNGVGNQIDVGMSIKVEPSTGNCFVTGSFADTTDFGSFILVAKGEQDVFITTYDGDGNVLSAKRAGGKESGDRTDMGLDIALDNHGNSYIVGNFEGEADFDSNILTSFGGKDIFYAKVESSCACVDSIIISGTLTNSIYQAEQTISTFDTTYVESGVKINIIAGNSITLNPGTYFAQNSEVTLSIGECTFLYPVINEELTIQRTENTDQISVTTKDKERPTLRIWPNPFKSSTTIQYMLLKEGRYSLAVYSLLGQRIKVLVGNQWHETGNYQVAFYPENLPSGIYYLILQSSDTRQTEKIIILNQ